MKNYKYIFILLVLTILFGCDTNEPDLILPSSFDYIAFSDIEIITNEANTEEISVEFIYSSGTLSQEDLTFQYTVSSPEGLLGAEEGIDYTLPSTSGSLVLPAGQSRVSVPLLTVLDNDASTGTRYVSFTLENVEGFINGAPDNRELSTIVAINEDDLFEFGYTSFEEVQTFDTLTTYPRPGETQDPMPNIQDSDPASTAPFVAYVSTGNELGFVASFVDASVSEIENERVGVYNTLVMAANEDLFETTPIDGNQAYVTSDLDGFLTLTFDEIVGLTPDVTNAVLDIKLFFRTTTWESEDGIVVYFETEDGLGDPIVSIFDDDVEDVEGAWQDLRFNIPDDKLKTGRIVLTMRNGAGSETIIVDSISIKGIL